MTKKLKYKIQPPNEGGSALPGCGTIHIEEISKTLDSLTKKLDLDYNLNKFVVGSTGKREYSGDIDLVINADRSNFLEKLRLIFPSDMLAKNGNMIHLKFPITNFNIGYNERLPRTGFVQIDFNFGDVAWDRFYHYSEEDSEYKGAHRNLAISAICSVVDLESSNELDTYCRPLTQNRWKWSPYGFFRVCRKSLRDSRTNIWMKKQNDEVLLGPVHDPEFISRCLFPVDGEPSDLNSLETIISAVKRNYGMTDCEKIWSAIAKKFSEWNYGRYFEYPVEIEEYFSSL